MRQEGRFAGFSLFVSNKTDKDHGVLCYRNGPELPPLDVTISCIIHARYVIYYNDRLNGTNYPAGYEIDNVLNELCEVTVRGNVLKFCPSLMVAYFCHHLSDNYVDLSELYVVFSDLNVDLSDLYVDLSLIHLFENKS